MSFVTQEDVFTVAEAFCKDLVKELLPNKKIVSPSPNDDEGGMVGRGPG